MAEIISSNRYRNTLEDVIGVAMRKAREDDNELLADALSRWRNSTDFRDPNKNGRSLYAYTQGMPEPVRRKFHDAVSHARSVAEAAARTFHTT